MKIMNYERCIGLLALSRKMLADLSKDFEGELSGNCDSFINVPASIEVSMHGNADGYHLFLMCWAYGEMVEIKTDAVSVLEVRQFFKKHLDRFYKRLHGQVQGCLFDYLGTGKESYA